MLPSRDDHSNVLWWSDDELALLAGTSAHGVFFKGHQNTDGFWAVGLHKDRKFAPRSRARADAIAAYYKPWLPPWIVEEAEALVMCLARPHLEVSPPSFCEVEGG